MKNLPLTVHSSNWGGTLQQWALVHVQAVVPVGHQSRETTQTMSNML